MGKKKKQKMQTSETFHFECDLSGVGRLSGCLYLQCAREVFSNAQTGNVVLRAALFDGRLV